MASENKLGIKIEVAVGEDVIARRTAESWEVAEMELDSLKRWYEKEQAKMEKEAERQQSE